MNGSAIAKTEALDRDRELARLDRKRRALHSAVEDFIANCDGGRAETGQQDVIDAMASYRRAAMRSNAAKLQAR